MQALLKPVPITSRAAERPVLPQRASFLSAPAISRREPNRPLATYGCVHSPGDGVGSRRAGNEWTHNDGHMTLRSPARRDWQDFRQVAGVAVRASPGRHRRRAVGPNAGLRPVGGVCTASVRGWPAPPHRCRAEPSSSVPEWPWVHPFAKSRKTKRPLPRPADRS
jgi:hypothetical protein